MQQWYPDRKYQHPYAVKNQSPTNGIAHHVVNTDHEIDWINWKFLDTEPHWRKRKIKEALYIDCLNPQKEISDMIMNLEKGLNIPDCWKEFNADIRKIFFKKVPRKRSQSRVPFIIPVFSFSVSIFDFLFFDHCLMNS